jgi:oxygen-independent coproporphyrinogen-3 oxidase
VRGVAFTDEDRARSAAIERLMCDFAVDYGTIAQAYLGRLEALDDAAEPLRALVADGVVELDGRSVTITEAGKPFMRLAAAAFDTYLKAGAARHSVAV